MKIGQVKKAGKLSDLYTPRGLTTRVTYGEPNLKAWLGCRWPSDVCISSRSRKFSPLSSFEVFTKRNKTADPNAMIQACGVDGNII